MPAYSFQLQFVPAVESGDKTHTIRGKRRHPPRVGQRFIAYYAQRTKHCRKLLESTITRVQDITLDVRKGVVEVPYMRGSSTMVPLIQRFAVILLDGEEIALDEMHQLAIRDGFQDVTHMLSFWDGKLPFRGDLIHWRPAGGAR